MQINHIDIGICGLAGFARAIILSVKASVVDVEANTAWVRAVHLSHVQ
jgi:hypothetical protein